VFSSLITKRISNRQKNSVHVIGLHDVTATVGKTPLCKIWKSADAKKVILCTVHPNNVVLNSTEFLKYPKIHEFYWVSNVQVGLLNSQSSLWFTLYDESNHRLVKSLTVKSSRRRRRSTCQINDATQPFPQSRIHERLDFVIGEFTCQRHGMSIAYVDDFTQGRSQAWAWGAEAPQT